MKAIALLALAVSLETGFLFTLALPASTFAPAAHAPAVEARADRGEVQVRVVTAPIADPVRS